ncbi:hypothetical protein OHC33_005671 [Knufia fluminis]|uniref:Major facilitator superfamily (MFS) profile domain-containing protein n=1 Tax=Knufia fluminis TaxID=191047 RepID=A0AAN8EDS8_9EURO|nr:hypothetical protein OHC33_005671 [Knufia fluminis]
MSDWSKPSIRALLKRSPGSVFPTGDNSTRPWLLRYRSSTVFITISVVTAVFVDIFLYAVIVPVFPFSLVDRVGISEDDVQWWMSILFSMEAIGLLTAAPIFGYLSDAVANRKRPIIGGMLMLSGATVMLCLAKGLPLLIVGRLLAGASAAVVWVVGLALLAETVEQKQIGQYMGYVGMANSVAALLAPLLGGIVYEKAGYYAVFGMGFGIIVIDLIFGFLLVEKKEARKWSRQQEPETETTPQTEKTSKSTSQQPTALTRTSTGTTHDTATRPGSEGSTPESTSAILNRNSKRSAAKRVPPFLILLRSRRMQAAFVANVMDAMVLTAFDVTLPLFVEDTFGWNALGSGLVFLALLSPSFIQPLYGMLIDRHGAKPAAVLGLLLCIPPFVCLKFITYSSLSQKILLCSLLFIIGLGAHLTLAATMTEFTNIASQKEERQPGSMGSGGAYAQSYSLFNMSWALGSLAGSYFAGGIRERGGWGTMGWAYAVLCAVVSIPTLLYCGGWIGDGGKRRQQRKLALDADSSTSASEASV